MVRIALANLRFPAISDECLSLAAGAINEAAKAGTRILCFPEEFVPGYRPGQHQVAPLDPQFLECAWDCIATATRKAKIPVALGTECLVEGDLRITCLVLNPDGITQGW